MVNLTQFLSGSSFLRSVYAHQQHPLAQILDHYYCLRGDLRFKDRAAFGVMATTLAREIVDLALLVSALKFNLILSIALAVLQLIFEQVQLLILLKVANLISFLNQPPFFLNWDFDSSQPPLAYPQPLNFPLFELLAPKLFLKPN